MNEPSDITDLLTRIEGGGRDVVDRLYAAVYDELRRLAQYHLGRERSDHTLQATALVNEAYMRMVDQQRVEYQGRSHFFALAAQAMRRILVDHARKRQRDKRGGGVEPLALDAVADIAAVATIESRTDVLALDEALTRLGADAPDKAQIVEMRFFAGLSNAEAATVLGISERTVERHWQYARAWLFRELRGGAA